MSEIGNVSNPNLGMEDTGRVNEGSLPVPIKANAPNPVAAEMYDDAEALVQEPLHSQYADSLKEWDLEMTIFPLFQDLLEATSKMRRNLIEAEHLVKEIASGGYAAEYNELRKKQVEDLLKELNSIAESVDYEGNKLLTAEGRDVSIPIADDETVNVKHLDLTFGVEQLSWANAGNVLDTIVREIKLIGENEDFLLGVSERLEDVTTLMKYKQGTIFSRGELVIDQIADLAVNKVREKMKGYSADTLNQFDFTDFVKNESKKFSTGTAHKAEETLDESILNVQAHVEPERVLNLMGDEGHE